MGQRYGLTTNPGRVVIAPSGRRLGEAKVILIAPLADRTCAALGPCPLSKIHLREPMRRNKTEICQNKIQNYGLLNSAKASERFTFRTFVQQPKETLNFFVLRDRMIMP